MIIKPFIKFTRVTCKSNMYWWSFPNNIKGVVLEKSKLIIPPFLKEVDDYVMNYTLPSNNRMMKILKKQNPVFRTLLDHCELYMYSDKLSERTKYQLEDTEFDKVYFSTIEPIKCIWYFDLN